MALDVWSWWKALQSAAAPQTAAVTAKKATTYTAKQAYDMELMVYIDQQACELTMQQTTSRHHLQWQSMPNSAGNRLLALGA